MRVRLIKKLADRIDGVDLRGHEAGETLDLARDEARLLMAEGWAVAEGRRGYVSAATNKASRHAIAADRRHRSRR